jgi:glycosyltransferase involved in cell wall biosynthesis
MERNDSQPKRSGAAPAGISRIIVEHLDPEHLVPGGIDTCVHDVVKYARETVAIVGITTNPDLALGEWTILQFAGRTVPFLPVARFDRSRKSGPLRLIPHSLLQAAGTLRYRAKLPDTLWQAHRIETGFLLSLLRRQGRLVQFVHNDSTGLVGPNSDSSWKGLVTFYRLLERRVMKRASGVVVFNATDAPRMKRLRTDVTVAQTWYDPETFVGRRSIPAGSFEACWIGRFEAQKDPLLAISTVGALSKEQPDARITFVGTGSLEQSMRARAEELGVSNMIRFAGNLPRAEVAKVMASSGAMLMTSHYEGSPRVLAEAGAVGLPIVATDGSDPDRALTAGYNGIRLSSRQPDKLAAALLEVRDYSSQDCIDSVRHRSAPAAVAALLEIGRD